MVCDFWRYKAYVDIRRGSLVTEVVANESAVVENASSLIRSPYIFRMKFPHWLYISKFTRLRAFSWRQHGSYTVKPLILAALNFGVFAC